MTMKLSEFKGEKAIEVFADLLEPVSEILADEEIYKSIQNGLPQIVVIKKVMKKHPKAVITLLAVLDDEDPETYEVGFTTIPIKLMELMSDEALVDLFTSQGRKEDETVSGSAMENTEGDEISDNS